MKILLLTPSLSVEDRYGKKLGKVGSVTEPLGLAYLASCLKKDHEVKIIDGAAINLTEEELIHEIKQNNYDIIGTTILTPMYLKAQEIIQLIKSNFPEIKIIVGGPHITIFPEQTMKENPEIDFSIIGEGEITMPELMEAIEGKRKIETVKGISYRKNNKIITTPPRLFIKDIDEIPLPARDLLDLKRYKPAPTYYKKLPSHIILTSRGCPYRCTYCSKVFGNTYRHHSVERVIKEMKILIKEYKAKEIIFRDDTFTINKKFTKELCNTIIKENLHKKIRWTCMTRVNLVTKELLQLMKKSGCWSIHYGIESGSQRLLDLIQKDITIKQIKDAIKWTKQAKIEIKAFFMIGLPTETKEETLKTIRFTKELDPDWIQVTITVPYPGTKLYEIAQKDKTLKSLKWENYQTWAGWSDKELVYVPKGRTQEEIKELQKKAMREFYLRPKFILKQLKNLTSINSIKTYIQGAYAIATSKK